MLIRTFVPKVIIIKMKILAGHKIIDCIAEKIVSVIFQVCTETKLWIHPFSSM